MFPLLSFQIELHDEEGTELHDTHSDAGSISIASTHSICSSPFSSASLQNTENDPCASAGDDPAPSTISLTATMQETQNGKVAALGVESASSKELDSSHSTNGAGISSSVNTDNTFITVKYNSYIFV